MDFTQTNLKIKLNFFDLYEISRAESPNKLVVKINDRSLFTRFSDNFTIAEDTLLEYEIPK